MESSSGTPSLYPHVPPPPSSSKSFIFQPSAPPSAPPSIPSAPFSPSNSAPPSTSHAYPALPYSPSAPPPSLSLAPPLNQEPWRASSNSPTEADLQTERLYSLEPSAPLYYPSLDSDQYFQSYPHEQLSPYRIPTDKHQFSKPRMELNLSAFYPQFGQPSELLRSLYENEHLKTLPQRLAIYDRASIIGTKEEETDIFYEHMRSYETAHETIQQSKLAIFNLQQKAKGYASKLWIVQTKSEVAKASCGDGATISHNYSYRFGHHEPEVATKLKKSLNRLFKQRTKSLVRMQFEETSHQLWIQNHIATFLNDIVWVKEDSNSGAKRDVDRTPRTWNSSNERDLKRAKCYLDTLFHFERSVRRQPDFDKEVEERKGTDGMASKPDNSARDSMSVPTNSILQSIQRWIVVLAAALLQHGGYMDYEYLTVQVLRTRQVSGWAANLIQCSVPTVWSNAYQDFFITELELVLCGSTPRSWSLQGSSESALKPELDLGSIFEEDDYLTLLDQLDEEVDRILVDITRALLALPGNGLWTFLPSIPFKYMSSSTIALLLQEFALENIQQWVEDPLKLLSNTLKSNNLRDKLGSNPGEAVFLLSAMAIMATSRFSASSCVQNSDLPLMEQHIVLIITFLILDAAYMDDDIRGELMKPGREILSSICDSYPEAIAFILRFIEINFKEVGDMAQYLFRGLPLEEWRITSDDFMMLKRLLEASHLNSPQSQLARYIFSSLPWNYEDEPGDNSDQVKVPIVFRKELALTMADICVFHLTSFRRDSESPTIESPKESKDEGSPISPTPTKSPDHKFVPSFASGLPHAITNLAAHSGIHRTVEQVSMKAFMDWCWSMLGKLELTEVPVISLVEASRLHVQDPGLAKYPVFSQGQLAFVNTVHMLLTQASRDSEQFLQEGWTTLTSILQAGVGSVFLEVARRLIPLIIDSEKDLAAHAARLGQLVHEMASLKQDLMLAIAGANFVDSHRLFPGNASKELLGIWSLIFLHMEHIKAQNGDPSKVLKFWMSAVFSQKDWMAHQEYVQVLDVVCLFCFKHGYDTIIKDALMEQQIMLSIGFRRAPGISTELMGLAQPGLDRVMEMLPERFSKSLPVPQGSSDPSLLMGTWSVRTFATNLLTQQAMIETSSIWFAYYVLLIETSLEREMRIKVGNYYQQHPGELKTPNNIKTVMKTLGITSRKTLHNFAIWRWAQHLLILPYDTFLLPLYWQMFFYLYFGHVEKRDLFYGFKFLETNPDIVEQLRDRLQKTYTHFGQEARKAIQELDSNRAVPLTALHEFYIALYGWISEPLLLTPDIDLKRIRKDLMPDRLITCRLPDPLECNSDLWKDLLVDKNNASHSGSFPSTPVSPSASSPPRSYESSFSPQSRRSHDQNRAMRKHSHAWQERKISNCLVKQAKARPEFYIPRVLVQPAGIDSKSTPQSLFNQPARVIKDYCKTYHAMNQAYENLDSSYLTDLGALYHNEVKATKLEIACDTTPNALCQRPAVIELNYEEIVQNDKVMSSIIENRERARASRLGSVEQGLCLAALEISKTIDNLSHLLSSDPSKSTLQDLSIQSFYFLCKELLEDARGYPPAQMILTSIVDTLGMEIVAKDPAQTEPILDMMKIDDFTIAMIHKTFYPAALPHDFVRLYQKVATCKDYGLVSKDLLLRQFDVQAWACDPTGREGSEKHDGPSVLDRLAFYEVAFTAMVSQQQLQKQDDQIQEATELSTRDRLAIIKSHRELAGTLFLNFLQQDYIEYLRILFNTCGIMCLEPEVLEDYIRIMGVEPRLIPALLDGADVLDETGLAGKRSNAFTKVTLSDYDLGRLIQFLADYFNDCQEQLVRGNLLDQYSGYAVSIASLLTVVLCDERYLSKWMKNAGYYTMEYIKQTPSDSSDNSRQSKPLSGLDKQSRRDTLVPEHCRMWRDTLTVFQPWLSCLTKHAVDEIRFQRQQSGASRLLFTFVGVVSKLMGALQIHYLDLSPMLAEIYGLWLEMTHESTLGQGCINQTMLIHQHFHRLEWKGLELSKDRIERTLEVAAELSDEIRIEFWTYIVTLVMEKADSSMRPHALQSEERKGTLEWHQTEAAFLKLGLAIIQDVDLIAGNDMEIRQQFLDRLWATIFDAVDWNLLSTDELRRQVESLKAHWGRAGQWDDPTSPIGVLLYWMRMAVGLESTELNELEYEDTDDANNLSDERVLVYFGYVLRLLQTRLSSSAQDSQNVNFRIDAIPLVIIHLGQVLDRIAGSRFQEKHSVIYRPLSSLVGVLNLCGKESSSNSIPVPYIHSFDVVQRGLGKMIAEVRVIQLDIVKVVCQRLNSIPAMINLLEEAIEKEFDIWDGRQGSSLALSSSHSGSFSGIFGGSSGSMFGLEDTPLQQHMVAPLPIMMGHSHSRSLHHRATTRDTGGRHSWNKIKAQMETPELCEDEFLEQALKQGAILTIYGQFLQELEDCEQSLDFNEVLELGQELAEVISKVNLMAIEPWKAYQSLLLLRMFFNLVAKESVHSILQSRFLSSLKQVCRTLEVWCQDRDSTKGMLSSIGMGTRSSFDTKFRLVIRIIYTYVVVRLADKGVLIHQTAAQGGSMLAWRRARQSSGQSLSDGNSGNGSPLDGNANGTTNSRDTSAALIETLAQLPVKNKDYSIIFIPSPPATASNTTVATTATSAPSAIGIPFASASKSFMPIALASSPLDLVKKTIISSSPPANTTSNLPPRPLSSSSFSSSSSVTNSPRQAHRERRISQHSQSSKRMSFQSHHSRFSMGGSWDDTTVIPFEDMSEPNGSPSSSSKGLVATKRRFRSGTLLSTGSSSAMTEHRMRLRQGTKNGVQDLEWAVQQIKDRRFRILEAAEVLEEVMERFYEGDDYFA
ncbi:Ectopic P granules protein 5 [Mortierella sp. AM989]|nr:Ectopic P granules protein 5 [Mortierella sp. AM989]